MMETHSLGRNRQAPAARNHIVYTDHKGRKSDSECEIPRKSTSVRKTKTYRSESESEAELIKKPTARVRRTKTCNRLDSDSEVELNSITKKQRRTKKSSPAIKKRKTSETLRIPYADKITPEPILNNNAGRDTKADSIRNSYNSQFKVGIYGWRKKCLYILVMALMFMMIINLALTLWVLKVLDFNSEGMGQLRIVPGGLQLLGQALVLDSLFASSFKSRRGQPISIESSRNFSVSTRDGHGLLQSRLFLGHDRLEVNVARLEVRDARGTLLLGASADAVTVGADTLTVTSPAGVSLQSAVQTPLVRAPPSKQLVLESPTRSLEMHAAQNIALESRAGDISATCLTTFRLKSVAGSIRLEAPSIYMPKLKSALPLPPSTPHTHDPHHQNIYQLCACANGKLFLAPPHGACAAREESLICR